MAFENPANQPDELLYQGRSVVQDRSKPEESRNSKTLYSLSVVTMPPLLIKHVKTVRMCMCTYCTFYCTYRIQKIGNLSLVPFITRPPTDQYIFVSKRQATTLQTSSS